MNKFLFSFVIIFAGVQGQRISGGDPASIQQYSFATSLLTNKYSGSFDHGCGGSILTSNTILSAASCFFTNEVADEASWWRARVGSTNSNSGGTIHLLSRITPHPDFSHITLQNDIAVVRVTWPLTLAAGSVEPARIAGAAYSLETNAQVWAIGWGATSVAGPISDSLQHVQFFTIDQETCNNRYNELNIEVTSNMVCAGWLDVGVVGQCVGDTGSPLVQNGIVVGLFSHSESCGDGWYPNINTRVAPYTRWIYSTVYLS